MSRPLYVGALVGRAKEQASLSSILAEHRRAWISGLGGVGKTRLLAQLCEGHVALWVDAGNTRSPDAFAEAIASAMSDSKTRARPEGVAAWCRANAVSLVVFDDVDGVYEDALAWMAVISESVPVVASARSAVDEPWHLPLAPLDATTDAVALFLDRIPMRCASRPDQDRDAGSIRDLVGLLGGLPLAIELAAGRLEVLSLDAIEAGIHRSLRLLSDPVADGRHRSIDAALDWSYRLLDPLKRDAWLACSVFVGSFSLQGLCAVLDRGEIEVIDDLQVLIRHHLVDPFGQDARFHLHPMVRRFAQERRSAETHDTRWLARHAQFYEAYARQAFRQDHSAQLARSIRLEATNLRILVERAEQALISTDSALWAVNALCAMTDRVDRQLLLDRAALLPGDPLQRGRIHMRLGMGRHYLRDTQGAVSAFAQAEAFAREAGAQDLVLQIQGTAASIALLNDPTDRAAESRLDEAIAAAIQRDNKNLLSNLLQTRALALHQSRGDHAAALADKRTALAASEPRSYQAAMLLNSCAISESNLGQLDDARKHFAEAAEILRRVEENSYADEVEARLAAVAHTQGDLTFAHRAYTRALETALRGGNLADITHQRACLALLALERGEDPTPWLSEARPEDLLHAWAWPRATLWFASVANAIVSHRPSPPPPERISDSVVRTFLGEVVSWQQALERARAAFDAGHAALCAQECATARAIVAGWDQANEIVMLRIGNGLTTRIERRLASWRILPDSSAFAPPGGEWVSLGNRPTLITLLSSLDQSRPRSLQELGEIMWPEERILFRALRNRVYVALSTLRKLGLTLIVTTDDGWQLDPAIPIERL